MSNVPIRPSSGLTYKCLVFLELSLYLSHEASAAAMLIMACRSIGEEDNRIMSSTQVGTLKSTAPTENPRRLFSILCSRESPLTLKSYVEGMPPWRTHCVSLNWVQYLPSHFTAELIPLYRSQYSIHRSSVIPSCISCRNNSWCQAMSNTLEASRKAA